MIRYYPLGMMHQRDDGPYCKMDEAAVEIAARNTIIGELHKDVDAAQARIAELEAQLSEHEQRTGMAKNPDAAVAKRLNWLWEEYRVSESTVAEFTRCPRCGVPYDIHWGCPGKTPHKCPVCDGTGLVSKPPTLAGDVRAWGSNAANAGPYKCRACKGEGVLWR